MTIFDILDDPTKDRARRFMKKFYEALGEYLENWSETLDGTEVFSWMSLTSAPDWTEHIKPSLQYFVKHFGEGEIDSDDLFDETNLLCQIVGQKLTSWNEKSLKSDERWIEIFAAFSYQNRPLKQFSMLVQYAFAIPGSSTEVERLFSIINDVWGPDKPQMKLETLEAYLNIKVNSNMNCSEYYDSIKDNRRLLGQVQNTQKYREDSQHSTSTHEQEEESGN